MNNQIWGIITVLICSLGYFISWKLQRAARFNRALLVLVLCGLLLRVFTSADFFLHVWDERYHALVAKNLIHHLFKPTLYDHPVLPYDSTNWTVNHIWLSKPPVALWFISASIYLFGNNEIAVRIPSIILSSLAIVLTFKIAKLLFDRKVAWLAALLHSIHGLLIETAAGRISSDHVETVFIFFVELAILLALLSIVRKQGHYLWLALCGICIGISILCKWSPALIVFPIWLVSALIDQKFSQKNIIPDFLLLLFFATIVALPWFIYIWYEFPLEAPEMLHALFTPLNTVIQDHQGPPWYYLSKIGMVFGEIIYIPLLWMCYSMFKKGRQNNLLIPGFWILIPLFIFSFSATKRYPYLLLSAPALFIITALFFYQLSEYKKSKNSKWFYNLILFLLIALPVRYSIERVKPFKKINRNPQWASALRNFDVKGADKTVLFNYDKPIEAMFYANFLAAYPSMPDVQTIQKLSDSGYHITINDKGSIPSNIYAMKNIRIVHLPETD